MKRMAIEAIYRKPNTSKPMPGHKIYPYLLRNLPVTKPDQVWATILATFYGATALSISFAVIDWFQPPGSQPSRIDHHGSRFLLEALQEACETWQAEIFNSDQGSQFTSADFTTCFLKNGIAISRTAKARGVTMSYRAAMAVGQMGRGVSQSLRHVSEARTSIGSI